MSVDKYNSEVYNDPTTYEALTNIDKQDKAANKAAPFCFMALSGRNRNGFPHQAFIASG